jgi:quinol monooxygenase YgiN
MGDEISWQVELAVKPGELENFRALTREMVEFTKSETGVLIYERYVGKDGKIVCIYERYVDSVAAVAHLRAFAKLYGERFVKLVERRRFTVFGSPSDELREILDNFGATYMDLFDGFSVVQATSSQVNSSQAKQER